MPPRMTRGGFRSEWQSLPALLLGLRSRPWIPESARDSSSLFRKGHDERPFGKLRVALCEIHPRLTSSQVSRAAALENQF